MSSEQGEQGVCFSQIPSIFFLADRKVPLGEERKSGPMQTADFQEHENRLLSILQSERKLFVVMKG